MIDVAIKYFLIDYCIKTAFDRIMGNFGLDVVNSMPNVGDRYQKILHNHTNEVYYNCLVTEVDVLRDNDNNDTGQIMVYFSFEYMDDDDSLIYDSDEKITSTDRFETMEDVVEALDKGDITEDEFLDIIDEEGNFEPDESDFNIDYSEIDLITTADPNIIGVNHKYFTFYK